MKIFKLPDLGEGLSEAEIVEWHIKEGQDIKVDQILVSVETAKAVIEVPSPISGRIVKLFGKPGDIIKTEGPLVEFETETETATEKDQGTVVGKLSVTDTVVTEAAMSIVMHTVSGAKATPAVRALAHHLKVDLNRVTPTGPNSTVTSQDVELAAKSFNEAGPLEPLKGFRRAMAQTMSQAHAEVVPVTVIEDAKILNWSKGEDISIRLIQALIIACNKEPALNAWYDSKALGRRLITDVHLGIAMDSAHGLYVPVIRNADKLNAVELRKVLEEFKVKIQSRSVSPEELRGATITLSNFGNIGGRYATPIILPPMVAILGAGRLREAVVVVQGESRICPVLPLSLTVDHRAVTGGEAARFLEIVIKNLEG